MANTVVRLNEHLEKDEDGLWVTYKDYEKLLDQLNELQYQIDCERYSNRPLGEW